jgi:hypothetical protein
MIFRYEWWYGVLIGRKKRRQGRSYSGDIVRELWRRLVKLITIFQSGDISRFVMNLDMFLLSIGIRVFVLSVIGRRNINLNIYSVRYQSWFFHVRRRRVFVL